MDFSYSGNIPHFSQFQNVVGVGGPEIKESFFYSLHGNFGEKWGKICFICKYFECNSIKTCVEKDEKVIAISLREN